MNADDRTVSVICKTCGCPLAEVHAEYSPEHHRGLDDGTSGPVVTWWVRNEPLIATLQQLRQTNAETFRHELREQREPKSWPLDRLGPTVETWCDTHHSIPLSTPGLRARHVAAKRNNRCDKWRIPPRP